MENLDVQRREKGLEMSNRETEACANVLIEKEKDIFLEENRKLVQVDDDHPEQR
jgi:hypothetical protein